MSDFELALQNAKPIQAQTAAIQTTVGRYTQEVQGMVYMAKQFPRDQIESWNRIKTSCQRKTLAVVASYEYPRGGEKISGPSIRLAEVLAQNWGNMTYGVSELEQRPGESVCMAYAWDLETNVRSEKIFTVRHERSTKKGLKQLSEPRDIYEMVANMGARRQRSCILAVIPKDIVDAAVAECDKTLIGGNSEPLLDRVKRMLPKFLDLDVTREMIEQRIGSNLEACTEKDLLSLGKIYNSIRDGMGKREDYFEIKSTVPDSGSLADEFKSQKKPEVAPEKAFDAAASLALDAELAAQEEAAEKARGGK